MMGVTPVPAPKKPVLEEREYIVASIRCVWGKVGERIKLALTDMQELTHLQAGTLKKAEAAQSQKTTEPEEKEADPVPSVEVTQPSVAEKEVKDNG